MIYILSFWSDIGFSIKQALRTFSCNIAAVMYNFIVDLYNVFMYTARAEVLESSFIQGIYNKVGMILGIFMIFKLAFSLIQSLVDPNKFTDEKNGFGGIIKRSVISIVLLGITPSLFRMAFDLQDLIVGSANNTDNIIYKIIVGTAPSKDAESFGHVIASELYFGFYTENEPLKLNEGLEITYPDSGGVQLEVHNYEYLKTAVESGAMSFKDTVDYLSITSSGQYVINWDGLFAIGFAVFMIYILITYCIQVATRVMQLAYLQLIAPVPILSYISNPDGSFKNWTKQCLTTYLDLFIRLAIIYFIITVSTQILEAFGNTESVLFGSTGLEPGSSTLFWVKIFLIIGLLMFGKRVPDLLKDLFPNMGGGPASLGFGLKSPKKMLNDIPLLGKPTERIAKAGIGAGLIGAGALAANGLHGAANIRKTWKDNKGKKGRFGKTVGAGVKGVFSMAGGAIGGTKIGLKSGLKDNKLANFNRGIAETNANREKRELAGKAGYHWYTPWKPAADKVEAFAGDTTGAEKKIKTAQFRQEALQNSKAIQWQTFAERNSSSGGKADLSLLRSMQEFEEHGKKVWKGIDENGDERTFTYDSNAKRFDAVGTGDSITDAEQVDIVIKSATIDKQIKEQGKIIKGLELKKNDAEGKK